jgi:phosphotriesterase-related protein
VLSNYFVAEFEKKAIQATGELQAELGCPVSFHSGRDPEAPFEIIRLFQEAGGDVNKVVMSHLESKFNYYFIFISIMYKLLKLHMHFL